MFLSLNDGRKELYQWDTGRMATVEAECDIVHFSNFKYGESLAAEVKDGEVAIPNKLLMSGAQIYCWAFVKDEVGAYTRQEQTLDVIKRAKPSDYVYTETEVITIQKAVEDALQEAKESGEFKGEKGDRGEKGEGGTTIWRTTQDLTGANTSTNPIHSFDILESIDGRTPKANDYVLDGVGNLIKIRAVSTDTFTGEDVSNYNARMSTIEDRLDTLEEGGGGGNIDAALDAIIAIQNSLIGGDAK
jgi:hypothetical protein